MNLKPVLVEFWHPHHSDVSTSSAILIEGKYVLAPSILLQNFFQDFLASVKGLRSGMLHFYNKKTVEFLVVLENESSGAFTVEKGRLFGMFKCGNLSEFIQNGFGDWQVTDNNYINLKQFVSIFLVLVLNRSKGEISIDNLKSIFHRWLINTSAISMKKCDQILCVSTPFGCRDFLNSTTQGIISTTLKSSTLFLSDCTSAPGCEGGLIYIIGQKSMSPIAVVISSFNWWRRDWVGFTLIADIRPIISQLLPVGWQNPINDSYSQILDMAERSIVQVNCGSNWGSGILLSRNEGIFLTNAHVVDRNFPIRIFWKNQKTTAQLIYKVPDDGPYDLAVVKSGAFSFPMTPPSLKVASCKKGAKAYCAGFPLLSTHMQPNSVTVTQGIITFVTPWMLKTDCSVYPGFSGGAVFTSDGALLGVIVCNIMLGCSYPKYNMAIPFMAVSKTLMAFCETGDDEVLKNLKEVGSEAAIMWRKFEGKL